MDHKNKKIKEYLFKGLLKTSDTHYTALLQSFRTHFQQNILRQHNQTKINKNKENI